MSRKFVLTVVVLFCGRGTLMQLQIAFAVAVFYGAIHCKYQPFNAHNEDDLQSASLSTTGLTVICACLLKNEEEADAFSVVLVLINILTLCFGLYLIVFFTVPTYLTLSATIRKNLAAASALTAEPEEEAAKQSSTPHVIVMQESDEAGDETDALIEGTEESEQYTGHLQGEEEDNEQVWWNAVISAS